MNTNNKILIATGGTGGHVFPAYSLAQHFSKNKFSVEIITDQRGFKFLKNYQDIKIKIISSTTIFKKNPIIIFLSLFKIFFAFIKSIFYLLKLKPKIVFGMGGYSSFPVCLAAKVLSIPFIIYENNLYLGKANRYLLPYATKLFVSYAELKGFEEKYSKKIFEIGNIIREDILNYSLTKINNTTKEKICVLILGGSQAAKSFAEKLPEVFKECVKKNIKLKVYQQCLAYQTSELKKTYDLLNIDYEIFNFSSKLLNYFPKIDFAITRSGSSMLAELLNCNIPMIAIPLPSSADQHQLKNAKYFEKKGYGFLIQEKDIDQQLLPLIEKICRDQKILNEIIIKQREYSDKNVFKKIYNQVKEILNDKN